MKKSAFWKILIFLMIAACAFLGYVYFAEPDFLLDRVYPRIYADRLAPEVEVMLNENPAAFDLTEKDWSIEKNNGTWYLPPGDREVSGESTSEGGIAGISPDESKADLIVTSHEDKLQVNVDKEPDQAMLKIINTESGQIVLEEQTALPNLPLTEQNGMFVYQLTLEWTGETGPYKGNYVIEIPVTVDLPEQFVFSDQQMIQGQLLEVDVYNADNPDDIIFEQSLYDKFQWFQEDGFLRGYLPTNYNVKPGTYEITYGLKSRGTEFTQEIELKEYDYHIQYLTVDSKTEAETRNDAAYAEYHKYYTPVRNQSAPERYDSESFVIPVKGELTTEFGSTRYVNDFPTSYRHLGLDISAEEGTEVKATNRGKVVLARLLTLTGNTVMIDHGEGIFSVYHHMKSLSVSVGDMVEREQMIGAVGTTGFSTGPHLHFMISYYNMNLEPGYFLVGQPITFENYQDLIQ